MKKVLVLALCLLMLTGCSSSNNNETVGDPGGKIVTLHKGQLIEVFEDDLKNEIINAYKGRVDDQLLSMINVEAPKGVFKTLNGSELKMPENKTVILEIISPWCHFCQDLSKSKVFEEVAKNNPEAEVIQYFVSAKKEDVETFYETIEMEISEKLPVTYDNQELEAWLQDNEFYSVPMMIVINSDGTIGLIFIGADTTETYDQVIEASEKLTTAKTKDGGSLKDFFKNQKAAAKYIKDLEKISVPKKYFE